MMQLTKISFPPLKYNIKLVKIGGELCCSILSTKVVSTQNDVIIYVSPCLTNTRTV